MVQALVASGDRGIVFAGTGAGTLTQLREATRCTSIVALPAAKRPVLSCDRAAPATAASSAATTTMPWA